jgi:ABC-type transporter Mla MlaB component
VTADDLTPKQHRALEALLTAPNVKAAAQAAGCGERTLHVWLKEDAAFIAAYQRLRRESVRQATAQLQQVSARAVAVLVEVMENTEVNAQIRVSAAGKVLDMAIRAVELEDIEARLVALEGRLSNGR